MRSTKAFRDLDTTLSTTFLSPLADAFNQQLVEANRQADKPKMFKVLCFGVHNALDDSYHLDTIDSTMLWM